MSLGIGMMAGGSVYGGNTNSTLFIDAVKHISNLSLYLQNGVGNEAAQWADSSGNGNDATQGTEGDQAAPSGGGLVFVSGEGDHYDLDSQIEISAEEGFTIFATLNLTAHGANQTLLGLNNIDNFLEFVAGGNNLKIKTDGAITTISPGDGSQGDFQAGEKFLFTLVRESGSDGNYNVYKNGALLAQDSQVNHAGAAEFIAVGVRNNNRFLNATLYDLAFYEKQLSAAELVDVHAFLTNYHGLR